MAGNNKELWDDDEFMAWFNDRPPAIQAVIRKYPPWFYYRVHGGPFPGKLYSYDENKDGTITIKIDILSPVFPRRVFGVKLEDLEIWREN